MTPLQAAIEKAQRQVDWFLEAAQDDQGKDERDAAFDLADATTALLVQIRAAQLC